MLDYMFNIKFGTKSDTPISTQIAVVKCFERYLKGKYESHVAPQVVEKLCEIITIDELDADVLKATSLGLIRPMFNARFTTNISKEARRKAAFIIADYPKKVIDLLANVAIGDSWISTLAIMVHKFDEKKLRSDIRDHEDLNLKIKKT